jgi:chromosome segregation ATPase
MNKILIFLAATVFLNNLKSTDEELAKLQEEDFQMSEKLKKILYENEAAKKEDARLDSEIKEKDKIIENKDKILFEIKESNKQKDKAIEQKDKAIEQERAAKEQERAAKEQERAAKEKLEKYLRSIGVDPDTI